MATAPIIEQTVTLEEALDRIKLEMHPEQGLVADRLETTARLSAVGFVEAPTATGKTLAIAHHALELSLREEHCVVLAVPTIELAHQAQEAIERLRGAPASIHYANATSKVVLGRNQFVSPEKLSDLVQVIGDTRTNTAREITAWLNDGAPGRSDGYAAYTRDGLLVRLASRGLRDSVPDSVALGQGEVGPANDAYRGQFVADARIHVVTHAMLARDLVTRFIATSRARIASGMTIEAADYAHMKVSERIDAMREAANIQRLECEVGDEGGLPEHRRLIVDEAHLLRANFESAMSTAISLTTLVRNVDALHRDGVKGATKAVADEVRRIRKEFIGLKREGSMRWAANSVRVDWAADEAIRKLVERLHDALDRIKAASKTDHDALAVIRAKYAFRQAVTVHGAVSVEVSWSPDKAFPGITLGRRNIAGELDFLWRRLRSAALVSATLYTENVAGPSAGYMAGRLAVPEARRQVFPTIAAPWLVDPVTAHLPSEAAAAALMPNDADQEAWLDETARRILAFATGTGTLVLNTSRATTAALASRLRKAGQGWRTIDGTSDSVTALKQMFIRMAKDGQGPIWLAQGPAWTGLDLPDASLDTVVITRLPYPMPVSITNEARKAREEAGHGRVSYGPQAAHMAMTLKQGIGRLVRTRKAGPKHLVMLDGRIRDRTAKGAEQLIRRYRVEEFD